MTGDLLHVIIGLLILAGGAFVLSRGETTARRRERLSSDNARFAGGLLLLAGLAYLAVKVVFKSSFHLPWGGPDGAQLGLHCARTHSRRLAGGRFSARWGADPGLKPGDPNSSHQDPGIRETNLVAASL
jgi:hypothetical protein